jgi:hypothetical protein
MIPFVVVNDEKQSVCSPIYGGLTSNKELGKSERFFEKGNRKSL